MIALMLCVAGIALLQLEANGTLKLDVLRGFLDGLMPVEVVLPTPAPVEGGLEDPEQPQRPSAGDAAIVLPDATDAPYEGIAIDSLDTGEPVG